MSVLDILPTKSLYRDYTLIAQDSIFKIQIEAMKKSGVYKDLSKSLKKQKFSYKIVKNYPKMDVRFSEVILNGFTPVNLAYDEEIKIDWKIKPEKEKVGAYNTQKAAATFGGRIWTAWFSPELPFQDGPYKFFGLPGLIVKIQDTDKDYTWELQGNKQVKDFSEMTYLETLNPGGAPKDLVVSREKFESTFAEYKKDPFASLRTQIPAEAMSQKMPGNEMTIGEMVKQQEKQLKDFYNAIDNPVELREPKAKK